MPKVTVAQLGARMHYAVPRILQEAGMLSHFYTDICATHGFPRLLRKIVPKACLPNALQRLFDRIPKGIPQQKISTFPLFGLKYKLTQRRAKTETESTKGHLWAGQRFGNLVNREGFEDSDAVYAFRSAALNIFEKAQAQGVASILEQPNAHRSVVERLLDRERREHSEWYEQTSRNRALREEAHLEKKERSKADVVLCGSQFVKDSIDRTGESTEKCLVVPYGVDVPMRNSPLSRPSEPLQVLMAGTVGLRKGAPYLAAAARESQAFTKFRAVGTVNLSEHGKSELSQHIDLRGRVPRSDMQQHYEWADAFVLPSVCEGSATVVYEALAHGLPVVCTPHTGSIVRDEREGFIIPVRNSRAIVNSLDRLARSPKLYEKMSEKALQRYRTAGDLDAYASRLVSAVRDVL